MLELDKEQSSQQERAGARNSRCHLNKNKQKMILRKMRKQSLFVPRNIVTKHTTEWITSVSLKRTQLINLSKMQQR